MKIAILADIHGNYDALEAVALHLNDVDSLVVLGDIVGYGAEPERCVQWVMKQRADTILGNHDAACVGILPITWFNSLAANALFWTKNQLSVYSQSFFQKIPQVVSNYVNAHWVHGSLRKPLEEYIDMVESAREIFNSHDFQTCFFGHTHVAEAFLFHEGKVFNPPFPKGGEIQLHPQKRYLINPGSVGQPRDGNPQASFALYDTEKGIVKINRIRYNIQRAADKIITAGLPEYLSIRLFSGR
ncbi:MAG: metallophosphoesterase family protein [Atribacterota bacterium]|jgi:predicted phosphodiesterase|uniref:Phosphodiesterase n=1 Tax=Candidatus Atribacter allofermentans TaxID=1852833 RepID=A0A1V5SJK9_9BACT|nr:metallophosphoesterase family protein [Atribacterota bacterium]MDI9594707.1 metallophosphoesterase family protein [Atribacterota bacterium]OQA54667.1 MAG: phosphodiesterase [Candidatus Atribacteria bacterium ADurb.Bin276]HHT09735.1 metallophosphoesterase family protein [Candidatus Atribacteria bacterium]